MTVTLTGAATEVATTNAAGQYGFTGLADGTYTVTPTLAGYHYAPPAAAVTISGADGTQNFWAASAIPSYSLSGTVSYGGSKTGRVYVSARLNTSGRLLGTSIAGPTGSYTIRGLSPGAYAISARMDIGGHGAPNASDPTGTAAATIVAADVTGAGVTLTDPTPAPTPVVPTNVRAAPGGGVVLLAWDRDSTYEISWGTDANASNGGTLSVAAREDTHYFHAPLADGTTVFYKIRSLVEAAASSYSTPVPVTVGAPSGANTVSGQVTFPGTATGPLYVVVVDETDKVNGELRISRYPAPTSPVSYAVPGVGTGERVVHAILDQDADGVLDEGDLRNFNDASPVVVSGDTTRHVTLDAAGAIAATSTEHTWHVDGRHEYLIINIVARAVKLATKVTMFSAATSPCRWTSRRTGSSNTWRTSARRRRRPATRSSSRSSTATARRRS